MQAFTRDNFPFAVSLQNLVKEAREKENPIYEQWCKVGENLARHRVDQQGHANEHLDANLDLLLRSLEDEQALCMNLKGDPFTGGVFFLQIAMSKAWLFSIYEILRQTCETPCRIFPDDASKYCKEHNCIRCQAIKPLRDRLNRHRIPLAKFQQESRKRGSDAAENYHNRLLIEEETGSIGWRSKSNRTKCEHINSRRELSDAILKHLSTDWQF